MEKYYIVNDKEVLKEIEDYRNMVKGQYRFIKKIFEREGIAGMEYYMQGSGLCNRAFSDYEKHKISLYIVPSTENTDKFGKQLCKPVVFDDGSEMARFRKTSAVLKRFQDEAVKEGVVVNILKPEIGRYFKEFEYGGCGYQCFAINGKTYLKVSTERYNSITPRKEGFEEVKASEFYEAREQKEVANDTSN